MAGITFSGCLKPRAYLDRKHFHLLPLISNIYLPHIGHFVLLILSALYVAVLVLTPLTSSVAFLRISCKIFVPFSPAISDSFCSHWAVNSGVLGLVSQTYQLDARCRDQLPTMALYITSFKQFLNYFSPGSRCPQPATLLVGNSSSSMNLPGHSMRSTGGLRVGEGGLF